MAGLAEIRTGRIVTSASRPYPFFGRFLSDGMIACLITKEGRCTFFFLVYTFQGRFVVATAFGVDTGVLAQLGNVFVAQGTHGFGG